MTETMLDKYRAKELDDAVVHISEATQRQGEYTEPYPIGYYVFNEAMKGGVREGDLIIVTGRSGEGKCHGKGTKILMFDGSVKNVEDIKKGDLLMGDDSTSRKVLTLSNGQDKMYKIKPLKGGEDFIVNQEHILVLEGNKYINHRKTVNGKRRTIKYEIIKNIKTEISVKNYLNKNYWFKFFNKLVRTGVEFKKRKLEIDPYFIGLWLGDGTSENVGITTADEEIVKYLYKLAKKLKLKITIQNQENNKSKIYSLVREKRFESINKCRMGKHVYTYKNRKVKIGGYGNIISLKTKLGKLNLLYNKHIPNIYKINSKKNRLKLLAGLIDSDGYTNNNCLVFSNKNKRLCEDVIYLCRSLGYSAELKKSFNKRFNTMYYKVSIWGSLEGIPSLLKRKKCKKRKQIKNHLRTSFVIESLGVGNYYGFTLNGNGRYLLGDFTVTHNTTFALNISVNLSKQIFPSLFFSYEVIVDNLLAKFIAMGMKKDEDFFIYVPKRNTSGNLGWIKEKIKEGLEKYATKFIFIDHVEYLTPTTLKSSDQYRIVLRNIAMELKSIALELKVVIFLLAHVRKVESKREIELSDIAESSGVFQNADYVFSIARDFRMVNSGGKKIEVVTDEGIIKVLKNRLTGKQPFFKFTLNENSIIVPYSLKPSDFDPNFKSSFGE